ncbi:hypothetical protein [Metamycoplasma neophronis]|uniref:Uncharacterized protein n=1 Tax=Metamycoplasma neophronis TaxID=872983 RepID=A0ABY2Z092_9BACT|nr:hypothetical protein [Metamycoplasma neophronis]TPR54295.1 hypothetical protein FJR74_00750 [Metamycoplasma neophronis]
MESKKERLEINYDEVYRDPGNKFHAQVMSNIHKAVELAVKDNIRAHVSDETINEYKANYDKILSLKEEIKTRKKADGITAKKVGNVFIIIFSCLLIGLCFLSFLLKNKKIIKAFNEFEKDRQKIIAETMEKNIKTLVSVFSKTTMQELKDDILRYLKITKTQNLDFKEILPLVQSEANFASLYSTNKYDLRNSYFYDILYSVLEYRIVTTSASITISQTNSEGETYSKTLTGYHYEKTPFVDIKQATLIPTNYLPKLVFLQTRNTFNQKAYEKKVKKGEFVLEKPEFYKYYNHDFNDQISYLTYFQNITQDKYIELAHYFETKVPNLPMPKLNKYGTALVEDRMFNSTLLLYSTVHNWALQYIPQDEPITLDYIVNILADVIIKNLEPQILTLTLGFANKYIASENYEKLGDSYISTYKDLDQIDDSVYTNRMYLLNRIIGNRSYSLFTHPQEKNAIYEFKDTNETNNRVVNEQSLSMKSFYGVDMIDTVYVEGYAIDVPFRRFYPFEEIKKTLYSMNYHFSTPGAKLYANDTNNLIYDVPNPTNDEQYYADLIKKNSISYNIQAAEKSDELEDAIMTVNFIFDRFPFLKNNCKIEIDDVALAIYINDISIVENNNYQLNSLEAELKRLWGLK